MEEGELLQRVALGEEVGGPELRLDLGDILGDEESRVPLLAADARDQVGESLFEHGDADQGSRRLCAMHRGVVWYCNHVRAVYFPFGAMFGAIASYVLSSYRRSLVQNYDP